MRRAFIFLPVAAALGGNLLAHEMRPAYLEIRQTGDETFDLLWKVPARGDDLRLGLYVRLPEDCKDSSPRRGLFAGGAYVERWSVARRGGLDGEAIRIDGLAATLTDVLVRFERLDGTVQVARLTPSQPSFAIESVPSPMQVAATYLHLGVEHILSGIDHLLFVLALLFLVTGWRRVVGTVTAFTVAHSLTLAAATLGFVRVPGPPVETAIALSIVFVAAEIVHARRGRPGLDLSTPTAAERIFPPASSSSERFDPRRMSNTPPVKPPLRPRIRRKSLARSWLAGAFLASPGHSLRHEQAIFPGRTARGSRKIQASLTARSPWIVAFTFGLLHGFGFAGALSEVGLPQGAIPMALLFFNVGVEMGQLLFVAVVVGFFAVLKDAAARMGRAGSALRAGARLEIAAAYAIGAVASFWVVERTCAFWS